MIICKTCGNVIWGNIGRTDSVDDCAECRDWEICEDCQEKKRDAYQRGEIGSILCNKHYYEAMRRLTPTGLVKVPCYLRVR